MGTWVRGPISWEAIPDAQIAMLGRWLYWAEQWASWKTQSSSPDEKVAWRSELLFLLQTQDKMRAIMEERRIPVKPPEPSHMPQEALQHVA